MATFERDLKISSPKYHPIVYAMPASRRQQMLMFAVLGGGKCIEMEISWLVDSHTFTDIQLPII